MTAYTTRSDLRLLGNEQTRVWKSLTLVNQDTLETGLIEVWDVQIQDPSKWGLDGWTVGSGSTRGVVTFNLTGTVTGKVVARGR